MKITIKYISLAVLVLSGLYLVDQYQKQSGRHLAPTIDNFVERMIDEGVK